MTEMCFSVPSPHDPGVHAEHQEVGVRARGLVMFERVLVFRHSTTTLGRTGGRGGADREDVEQLVTKDST